MLFNSYKFILFFIIVWPLYLVVRSVRLQNLILLVASCVFYSAWSTKLLFLLLASTSVDYTFARIMDVTGSAFRRKILLTLSISVNLGLLCYFKYAGFFVQSLQDTLAVFGIHSNFVFISVILPIGISFYTFESINYMVDVYRRRVAAERSLVDFMLFITFFPHLVAGPIVRASDFLPQIHQLRVVKRDDLRLGTMWLIVGYFMKVVLADSLAPMVDEHSKTRPLCPVTGC